MKKILILILVALTMLSSNSLAYSDVSTDGNNHYLELLSTLKIMSGYDDGNFYPDNSLTRAQLAKIAVNISDLNSLTAVYAGTSPFADVPYTHWAANYVSVVTRNGMLTGYPDGSYRPEDVVTFEQAVTVCVRLLGYTDSDVQGVWPYGYIAKSSSLGLTDGVATKQGEAISRLDISKLVNNLLFAKVKSNAGSTQRYIESMGYKYYENLVVIASTNEDSTVDSGYVFTSGGTFKMDSDMISKFMFRKGNAVVDKHSNIIAFVPVEQKIESYVVNLTYDNKFTYYDNGEVKTLSFDGAQAWIYYKTVKNTWLSQYPTINTGHAIEIVRDENGNIMYMILQKSDLNGPITAIGQDWKSDLGIKGAFKVIKNGQASTEADIAQLDSLSYSPTAGIVWAYDKKVTGILENVLPSRDKVTSVVVSGATYTVDSLTASVKLGPNGGFNYGDTVVLIFGKDNKVVDVIHPTDGMKTAYGFLNSTGTKTVADSNGNSQTVFFSNLTLADGTIQELVTNTDYADWRGNLMQITFLRNQAILNSINTKNTTIDGVFNYKDLTIGINKVSKDVKILDVVTKEQYHNGKCISVYPQRLDNARLDMEDILYSTKNNNGEIDFLLLDNFTGDGLEYGFVIDAKLTKSSGSYKFNIGNKRSDVSSNTIFFAKEGQAAKFEYIDEKLSHVQPLFKITDKITGVDNLNLYTEKQKPLLARNVVVYKYTRMSDFTENYLPVDISEIVSKKDLNLEAYYDNLEINGGRIRVIIIK